ncbi:ankyrin repeat-containing protein ITN1-like [Bidens hawaiensis]|uniref:ankyrin repeat-containing protein ITN1-like n=1 Tax=Bidens hawaiensis TaxID=980011 RepID=UPI004049EBF5
MTPSNLVDPLLSGSSTTSGIRIDQAGKMTYVKQVTSRHNDTELHVAAFRGDVAYVKHILDEINSQMVGADFDAEVAKIRALVVNEVNGLGETALHTAAERGHLEVVKELLKYSDKETLTRKSHLDFDPLHIAASQGHHAIVKLLVEHDVSLCQVRSKNNATPLITAASRGHTAVVNELLSKDPIFLTIPKPDLKKALYRAARSGHLETVKSLLEKDPRLVRRTDQKDQTVLHVAVKWASSEVVKFLLCLPNMKLRVNALTKDNKTAFDIANGLSPSEKSSDIWARLVHHGAVRANQLNQPPAELINTVIQINQEVHGMGKEVKKFNRQGINKPTNSVIVAVLFAVVAFAASFMVPGGEYDDGMAVGIFFVFNSVALYMSLAVVVIHMMLGVRGEVKAERKKVGEVVSKLMWLVSVCTSVAFMAASYIVVGWENEWMADSVTVIGVVIMLVVPGTMMYYVGKWKSARLLRMGEKKIAKHLEEIKKNVDKFKKAAPKKDILDAF